MIAYGITGDWNKIALIDTEHERGRFYANRTDLGTGEFLYAPMYAPFSPEKYKDFVNEGAKAVGTNGVVIIDSFSHAWNNEGGILDIKDQIAIGSGQNSFTAWAKAGKEQNSLINEILSSDCHTIVTMRSKMDYIMVEDGEGKKKPQKVGLAPVQRDDTQYEFDIVLDIERNHVATASKDTTFLDEYGQIITPQLGIQLKEWLSNGVEPAKCSECKKLIRPTATKSISQVVEGTTQKAGKPLCMSCYALWIKKNGGESPQTIRAQSNSEKVKPSSPRTN